MTATTAADQLRAAIGQNLKYRRRAAGLSLRELSARSRLSSSLLSQLERGLANPTIEVLVGLAQALGMSFADLSRVPLHEPEVTGRLDDAADSRTLLSSPERRRFEVYESTFAAGDVHESAPHGRASEEWAYVLSGSVTLEASGTTVPLGAGESVRFSAEAEHAYTPGEQGAALLVLVSMPSE